MGGSRQTALGAADTARARRVVIGVATTLFVVQSVVTVAVSPDSVGERLLMICVAGVGVAGFAAAGLMVTARWKRVDGARQQ